MKHKEDLITCQEIIKQAEDVLCILANQIRLRNYKHEKTYETILIHFANADLNNNYIGMLKSILINFRKEVANES
jgi:hypothetical protein